MHARPTKKFRALSAVIAVLLLSVYKLPAAEPPKVDVNGTATAEPAAYLAKNGEQLRSDCPYSTDSTKKLRIYS